MYQPFPRRPSGALQLSKAGALLCVASCGGLSLSDNPIDSRDAGRSVGSDASGFGDGGVVVGRDGGRAIGADAEPVDDGRRERDRGQVRSDVATPAADEVVEDQHRTQTEQHLRQQLGRGEPAAGHKEADARSTPHL